MRVLTANSKYTGNPLFDDLTNYIGVSHNEGRIFDPLFLQDDQSQTMGSFSADERRNYSKFRNREGDSGENSHLFKHLKLKVI